MYVCVCACVRACVRACVLAWRACVSAAQARMYVYSYPHNLSFSFIHNHNFFWSIPVALCVMLSDRPISAKDTAKAWWASIRNQVEFPCSASSPPSDDVYTDPRKSLTNSDGGQIRRNRNRDCLPLNRSTFIAPTKEGFDMASQLLKMKRVRNDCDPCLITGRC